MAIVPTITRETPSLSKLATFSLLLIPPPICIGILRLLIIFSIEGLLINSSLLAPSKSTKCRYSAPSFTHFSAISLGSLEYTVTLLKSPWVSLTHLLSLMSIAGIKIILLSLHMLL